MLVVPVRRAGHTLGVLAVQNRAPRRYTEDEVEVLETVAMLLAELLAATGAAEGAPDGIAATLSRVVSATPLVAGIAVGPVVILGGHHAPKRLLADDPELELTRLQAAAEAMQRGLDALIEAGLPGAGNAAAATESREVLEAYRLVAADAGWLRRVGEVVQSGLTAEAAVHRVAAELRDRMRRLSDPYLRERLADLEDLAGRLLTALGGADQTAIPPGAILVARRLGPADLLDWHAPRHRRRRDRGGECRRPRRDHRPRPRPAALGGARDVLEAAEDGDLVVLDADSGQLILRPEADIRQVYARALDARSARQAQWQSLRDVPGRTADGTRVQLMLNVGLALELEQLDAVGAEGIGLFRTEIAMLARGTAIDVAEQAAIYARVLDAAKGRPVLFRTLDLGGDKLLPGHPEPEEENPAMGWRSLRIGLDRPALLRRQARALLLAAGGRPLSIMFPMVATVAEFCAARAVVLAEAARVRPIPEKLDIGTMLEVPALLWQLPDLLKHTDFISVGTNDLLQFLFAADRGAPALAGRYDLLSPPVFDLLEHLQKSAAAAGVPLSVCGEAAGRPAEALALVALGYTLALDARPGRAAAQGAVRRARPAGFSRRARRPAQRCRRRSESARPDRHLGSRARPAVIDIRLRPVPDQNAPPARFEQRSTWIIGELRSCWDVGGWQPAGVWIRCPDCRRAAHSVSNENAKK